MRRQLITGLLLLLVVSISHQLISAQEAASAEQVLAKARQLYTEQGPKQALPEFEKALALFRASGDQHGEAVTLGNIGNCYKRLGDYSRALQFHAQALKLKRELGDRLEEGKTLSHLGLVYWEMADYAKAIDQLTKAIAIAQELKNAQLEAAALNNLSLVYDEQGDYRKSLEQYQRALDLHRANGSEPEESYTLGNIGGVYLLLGHFREALHYYQQSLAISERLKLKQGASLDLGNIGVCYVSLGQSPDAIASFDRALTLATEAGLHKEQADWHKGKATAMVRTGLYGAALEEYSAALHAYESAGLKRELSEGLGDRGSLRVLLGDLPSAEADFNEAIKVSQSIGHPRGVTLNLMWLAEIESRRTRYEKAGALYQQAIDRSRQSIDLSSVATGLTQLTVNLICQKRLADAVATGREAVDAARLTGSSSTEAAALISLGDGLRVSGQFAEALQQYTSAERLVSTLGDPDLDWRLEYSKAQTLEAIQKNEEAIVAYRRAIATIESVRGQLREQRFRAGYIEDKYQVYISFVQLLLRLGKLDDAFQTVERLRARSYLEMLNRGQPPIRNDKQRQTEIALRERIRLLQQRTEEEQGKAVAERRTEALEVFSAELVTAEREYEQFLDESAKTEPGYAAVRSLSVPSASQVQSKLSSDTALVEYLVGESSLAIFVIKRDEIQCKSVAVRAEDFAVRVELLRDLIARPESNEWRQPAEALRHLLIDPVEQEGWLRNINQLVLVPHGVLNSVPFAALPRASNGTIGYLIERYRLTYLPAAAALTYPSRRISSGHDHLMALAPERSRLRFATQEAQTVAGYYPPSPLLLIGSQATESAFKQRAKDYNVIHFATHGYFNHLNPLFSGVELEAGRSEDGRLEVHEILGMQLDADLVTLSACDTAAASGYFSEVPPGDDLVGLTRAFLFAGSSAVLATLWEVQDRSTLEFMRAFYSEFPKSDEARALARAQRLMLRGQSAYRHPYYWAPFVLVGQPN